MDRLLLLVVSPQKDRLYQMANMAATAAVMNKDVHVFFAFDALKKLVEHRLDEGGPELPSIEKILLDAKKVGDLTIHACAASSKVYGYGEEDLRPVTESVVSMMGLLRMMDEPGTMILWV